MTMIEGLNIEYVHVKGNTFEAKMNLNAFHGQIVGMLNGGATVAFGEITAGMASNQLIDENHIAVGQTIIANHLKGKKNEGYIKAYGELLHKGRTTHVWSIRMIDDKACLICQMSVTNGIIMKKKDGQE